MSTPSVERGLSRRSFIAATAAAAAVADQTAAASGDGKAAAPSAVAPAEWRNRNERLC